MLTSEMIELKLPTLKSTRFSESTCNALLDLVLRECSTALCTDLIAVKAIADQDEVFAQWLADIPSGVGLANWLVRNPIWRDETPFSERLWQLVNVVVRLQALEHRFVDELATQKRNAIYHFAYGLSHELNNPLANIATRAGVLAHGEKAAERRQMLETIIDSAMRGSEMLGDLMLLARPPKLNPQSTDLTHWFESFVARSSKWAANRNLKIETKCELQSSIASFDPVAITEAAWCLVRNALEASPKDASVHISLAEVESVLRLSISDSGPGLSNEALKNCFDPYYSGREAGRGLGLGLSKAQLVASLHGGSVQICNRPAGGCEAILTWPVCS